MLRPDRGWRRRLRLEERGRRIGGTGWGGVGVRGGGREGLGLEEGAVRDWLRRGLRGGERLGEEVRL